MSLGVDFSQFGGPLAQQTIACWKQNGVEFAIVQYSAVMTQHLEALAKAAMPAEAYVYLYWGVSPWNQTPQDRTVAALNMAGGNIKRLWLDAEDSTHPYREDQLLECVRICEQAGMPTGIYTGRWWWQPNTGDSQAFKNLPLWHAEYTAPDGEAGPRPDLAPALSSFKPYGGWTKPTIWQFQNTHQFCGHSVDLNVQYAGAGPAPGGGDSLNRYNAFAGWFHDKPVPANPDGFYVMQTRSDFGLPADAKEAVFAVYLHSGHVIFFDGQSDDEAGAVGWAGDKYGQIRAKLGADGTVNFRCMADTHFAEIFCIGWFA